MSVESDAEMATEVVSATFSAWIDQDFERMQAGLAEDFIQWHSHIRREFTKAEHQALLRKIVEVMQFHYHDITYLPIEGGVLVRCLCDLRTTGGEAMNVPFAIVYRVRGGLIFRCDEYMDGRSIPPLDRDSFGTAR